MDVLNKRERLRAVLFLTFIRDYESDPLSPPEGEASQEEHPLDPLHHFSRFSGNFQINFLKGPCIF
jgi:hypothetical protein